MTTQNFCELDDPTSKIILSTYTDDQLKAYIFLNRTKDHLLVEQCIPPEEQLAFHTRVFSRPPVALLQKLKDTFSDNNEVDLTPGALVSKSDRARLELCWKERRFVQARILSSLNEVFAERLQKDPRRWLAEAYRVAVLMQTVEQAPAVIPVTSVDSAKALLEAINQSKQR